MDLLEDNLKNRKFNVSEIFYSIQGEGLHSGKPCVFVRMQGCELRCVWCDTPYALDISQLANIMTTKEIIDEIKKYNCRYVLFTGGEPLLQAGVDDLINYLAANGYEVAVETNGHRSIETLNENIIKVLDLKAPSSEMERFNNYENLKYLNKKDEIKIVIASEDDYEWAKQKIFKHNLHKLVNSVILSPVTDKFSAEQLAALILKDNLPVRLMMQMHKFIWGPDKRGV